MVKSSTASDRISAPDMKCLEAHLRSVLGCPTLALTHPLTRSASVHLRVGKEVLGTVDQLDEDGERSWAVTLMVLDEDLAR